MKHIKIIGGLFLLYFLVILGLLVWTWYNFDNVAGPTDFGGVVLLALLFMVIYYYVMMVWTWRLTMRYDNLEKRVNIQFIILFLIGVLPSVIWLFRSNGLMFYK